MYQLAKLQMLEFCYDFLGKYINREDYDLRYMDTDRFYLAMSGDSLSLRQKKLQEQIQNGFSETWLMGEYKVE